MTGIHPTDARIADLKRRDQAVARLRRLAKLLDSEFRVPGVGIRIGIDAVLGLVPVVGDAASALIGSYLIIEAYRLGVPGWPLLRMVANLAVDTAIGAIPFAGDLWDFVFRANDRNIQILARHVGGLPLDVPYEEAARRRR